MVMMAMGQTESIWTVPLLVTNTTKYYKKWKAPNKIYPQDACHAHSNFSFLTYDYLLQRKI